MLRRSILGGIAGTALTMRAKSGAAASPELAVALLAPLSGPWAQQGRLMLLGAKMAIDDINAAGGVQSLGDAKMRLVTADAGENTETAVSAAKRLVAENPDLAGGTGAWLSSFTIAVTEVTERAHLPGSRFRPRMRLPGGAINTSSRPPSPGASRVRRSFLP